MGAPRDGGADGKVIIERLCISLPYVEIFNSKVIKGFVPDLRSRYVFFVFRNPYVLCIYVISVLPARYDDDDICYEHSTYISLKPKMNMLDRLNSLTFIYNK